MGSADAQEIARLDLVEVANRIASRDLSSREVTAAIIDRVARIDPILNAFVELHAVEALDAAEAADEQLAAGRRLGPLHGVPLALKDLIWERAHRSRAGSSILADFVAAEDATVTRRLRRSGAILIGRLNLHEFAYGITTVNPHYGTTRNPWDIGRTVGGSSGGSAAAVAAGLVFGALGTDTGCSVRLPAAFTGVVGLRPSFGRVNLRGVEPLAPTLDTVGPLARTVADCALLFEQIDGINERDPGAADHPAPPPVRSVEPDLAGIRIGLVDGVSLDGLPRYVREVMGRAVDVFEALGARVTVHPIADVEEALPALITTNRAEPPVHHARWMNDVDIERYGPDVRQKLETGARLSATEYIRAQRYRDALRQAFGRCFGQGVDAFLVPTAPFEAPRLVAGDVVLDDDACVDYPSGALRYNAFASLIGAPALSVPCGFGPRGLPLGLQLVGAPRTEHRLLQIGHEYERATTWNRRPPEPVSGGAGTLTDPGSLAPRGG